jgi:Flp pilus assembly protein TadD
LLELDPTSANACNELGIAYAQLGRMKDATVSFERALRLSPDFSEAQENLTRARASSR